MPLPSELTFGVFDAAAMELTCLSPIILMCQVQVKGNKVFASLIDGGSQLNPDNATFRYLTRSTTTDLNSCLNGGPPKPGDVVRLLDYSIRRMSGKSEIVFIISKMQIIRHCTDPFNGLQSTSPYPFDTAPSKLQNLSKSSIPNDADSYNMTYDTKNEGTVANSSDDHSTYSNRLGNSLETKYGNVESVTESKTRNSKIQMPIQADDYASSKEHYSTTSMSSSAFEKTLQSNFDQKQIPITSDSNDQMKSSILQDVDYNKNLQNSTTKTENDAIEHPDFDALSSYLPVRRDEGSSARRITPYRVDKRQTGPVMRRSDVPFIEIKNLTPFLGRWIIKGRFINLGEPRTYSNSRGEGKIWTCDIIDSLEACGTIRCTFFNKAVDKFLPTIRSNEVYSVSKGTLKPANRKFNTGDHQFEIQLGEDAQIENLGGDDPTVPQKPKQALVSIAEISQLPKSSSVGVCAFVLSVSEISEVLTRASGTPTSRREVVIIDQSRTSISVTLWGRKASLVTPSIIPPSKSLVNYPIILIENVRIDEYNGRKLSTTNQTDIVLNPSTTPAVRSLYIWAKQFDNIDNLEQQMTSLTSSNWSATDKSNVEYMTIAEIKDKTLDSSEQDLNDKGIWFNCVATLFNIEKERQYFWVACPTCGKKLSSTQAPEAQEPFDEISSGFCSNCNKQTQKPTRKYILSVEISDHTGSLKCQAIADKGLAIMGNATADFLVSLKNKGNSVHQRYEDYFLQRLRKDYVFRIQAKSETFRDETRIRYRIFGVTSLNGVIKSDDQSQPNSLQSCQQQMRKECYRLIKSIQSDMSA